MNFKFFEKTCKPSRNLGLRKEFWKTRICFWITLKYSFLINSQLNKMVQLDTWRTTHMENYIFISRYARSLQRQTAYNHGNNLIFIFDKSLDHQKILWDVIILYVSLNYNDSSLPLVNNIVTDCKVLIVYNIPPILEQEEMLKRRNRVLKKLIVIVKNYVVTEPLM